MNMLPKALYDTTDWRKALAESLAGGEVRDVGGGEVEGHRFYCAAIFGHPALWAEAREAIREGDVGKAWRRGQRALRRAFTGRLRFLLDNGPSERARPSPSSPPPSARRWTTTSPWKLPRSIRRARWTPSAWR
jgi:hypothetical protein